MYTGRFISGGLAFLFATFSGLAHADVPASVYKEAYTKRLVPELRNHHVSAHPRYVDLVVFKESRLLEVYAGDNPRQISFIKAYDVLAASGTSGPKLASGDLQVPEGLYRVADLNPYSHFHLALHVGYPNGDDSTHARREGRQKLGGDIMIHGGAASIGCIAIGDKAIEEVFGLASATDYRNWQIVIAPVDLRLKMPDLNAPYDQLDWLPSRYTTLLRRLMEFEVRAPNCTLDIVAPGEAPKNPVKQLADLPSTGATTCGFGEAMQRLRAMACKAGADAIQIESEKPDEDCPAARLRVLRYRTPDQINGSS